MTTIKLDAKKFAWIYLIEHGYAGRRPSYYGGFDYDEEVLKRFPKFNKYSLSGHDIIRDAFETDIKNIGVNWELTEAPESNIISEFTDTFNEPTRKEILNGTLILKNSSEQNWVAYALEVSNVFEMMEQVSNSQEKFINIFGLENG